ncbi:MAG: acyl-CoA thioesterase [Flavobacteriales bacterium]|nr:acyl-CoA thioesterase [Flavobacteriales bacterium]
MTEIFNTPASTETTFSELMVPSYANFGGKVHGGYVLSMMDKLAYTCASTHSKGYCVTVSVDGVDFLQPINVGELVSMHARVNYVGSSSIVIGIKVIAENFRKGIVKHTNTSFFTMVAMDENTGKPKKVPGLNLENEVDIRRFIKGKERKEWKQQNRTKARILKNDFDLKVEIEKTKNDNCIISAP